MVEDINLDVEWRCVFHRCFQTMTWCRADVREVHSENNRRKNTGYFPPTTIFRPSQELNVLSCQRSVCSRTTDGLSTC